MATALAKITLSSSRDIPFNKLVLSQSNVRRVKSGVSIEELAEDIARRTLLQSLNVRPVLDKGGAETGMFEVPAGGRRFRALELLVRQKRMTRTQPVPCVVRTDGLAEEDSLAENVHREALHPLDQFRAFEALRDKGLGEEEIAARFFVSPAVVKQRLKLAGVCGKLLDVYAEDGMTLEQLMAFTVTGDHARQEQVWESLAGSRNKEPYTIRRQLTEGAVRLALPGDFTEFGMPMHRCEVPEHPAPVHACQLLVVPDQDDLRAGFFRMRQQPRHQPRRDHPGLVHHDDRLVVPRGPAMIEASEHAVDRAGIKPVLAQGRRHLVGGRKGLHAVAVGRVSVLDSLHHEALAGACLAGNERQAFRRGHMLKRPHLVGPQPLAFGPQLLQDAVHGLARYPVRRSRMQPLAECLRQTLGRQRLARRVAGDAAGFRVGEPDDVATIEHACHVLAPRVARRDRLARAPG